MEVSMRVQRFAVLGVAAAVAAVGMGANALGSSDTAAAPSKAAAKTWTVKLQGITFYGKKNAKITTAKVGDTLRFVWAGGTHNIDNEKAPSGAKKVNVKTVTSKHVPVLDKLTKKGTYFFYCQPHKSLGMTLTVTVK
jgi:plastocyanin